MTGVDFSRCVVHASPGEEIGYDYLVLATGSTDNYHGNEQLGENSVGLELTGFAGWLAWLLVHVWYLAGFRNRLMALARWAWYYLRLNRPIRIILQTPPDPVVSTLRTPDPGRKRAAPAQIQDGR